jgi:phosphoribosylamine-glycine ligase
VLDGNICALQAAKDHVNVFLYDGAIVPDPEGIITGGMTTRPPVRWPSATARPSTRPLTAVFRQIIADNRAGGWRKLKRVT